MCTKLLPLIFLCSLCSAGCSTLQTKVETQDRDRDGKPERRITRTYRDGALILQRVDALSKKDGAIELWIETIFHKDKRVFVTVCTPASQSRKGSLSRSYYPKGGVGISELDSDADGFLDHVTMHGPGGELIDVFICTRDGHLAPVTGKRLKEIRGMGERFEAGFRDLLKQDFGPDDNEER